MRSTDCSRSPMSPSAINIRKYVTRAQRLNELVKRGSLPEAPADFLGAAVVSVLNILVSGATQAGKATIS